LRAANQPDVDIPHDPTAFIMTTPVSPLHPRIAEIIQYLGDERGALLSYVGSLPDDSLTRRVHAARWSVAEILEHLSIVEDSSGRLISNLIKQARAEGAVPETETTSILGCVDALVAKSLEKKLVAPERVQPGGNKSVADSLESLRMSRERLLRATEGASGLDLSKVAAPHPVYGPINAYQWLLLAGKHELRHLHQMKNTVRELDAVQS
jgi:uncharacterized damage-inducible protein DinB